MVTSQSDPRLRNQRDLHSTSTPMIGATSHLRMGNQLPLHNHQSLERHDIKTPQIGGINVPAPRGLSPGPTVNLIFEADPSNSRG